MSKTQIQLQFVETIEDIRESLHRFNREATDSVELARSLLSQSSYWVWDSTSKSFGPSKFVGLQSMNMHDYARAREGKDLGVPFDGHRTQQTIARVIGEDFHPDESLSRSLFKWGRALVPDDSDGRSAFDGVDRDKWRFIALPKAGTRGEDWSDAEIEQIVADYFQMLLSELAGKEFNKSAHRTRLLKKLNGRSAGSVEFKHSNISAALDDLGLPYIDGYKPRRNYQKVPLRLAIEKFLDANPTVLKGVEEKLIEPPKSPPAGASIKMADIEEEPPEMTTQRDGDAPKRRAGRKIDWAKVNAGQSELGKSGEEFVLGLEKRYLIDAGRRDLAEKVEWTSKDKGDGEGYDISSFDAVGNPKYVEVKTTNGGKATPFFLVSNELQASVDLGSEYWLYRVFHFSSDKRRRLYRLNGSLVENVVLEPCVYRARCKLNKP